MPSNNSPHTIIELSIIVLSYNTAALTKQTVESNLLLSNQRASGMKLLFLIMHQETSLLNL